MPFFAHKKTLFAFLNDATLRLTLYDLSGTDARAQEADSMTFPEAAVRDSGVVDANAFGAGVDQLLAKHPAWKQYELILVIPEEKIYLKGFELELGDLERKEELVNDFLDEVPFRRDEIQVRERLVGRVFELAAVEKDFLTALQRPFLDAHIRIAGAISVPHALALELPAEGKSFVLAFYDSDFVLALVENASVLFSETRRMISSTVREAMRLFDKFVQEQGVEAIKSVSVILGDAEFEDALKLELEERQYLVKKIKKIHIMDLVASYVGIHSAEVKEWNLIPHERGSLWKRTAAVFGIFIGSLMLLSALGWFAYVAFLRPYIVSVQSTIPTAAPIATSPAATITPPVVALASSTPQASLIAKIDYPITILNGTRVAGEATRLKAVLVGRGFAVQSIGNNSDQTQAVTTLFVSSDVSDILVSELRLILEEYYRNVLVNVSPVTTKDIHIVIGVRK